MSSSTLPSTNYVTDAVSTQGQPYLTITSNGTPQMTKVVVSDGRLLGLVQEATWSIDLAGFSHMSITTIATPAELSVLLKDVDLAVRPAPGYNPFKYLWDWVCAWVYNVFTR